MECKATFSLGQDMELLAKSMAEGEQQAFLLQCIDSNKGFFYHRLQAAFGELFKELQQQQDDL